MISHQYLAVGTRSSKLSLWQAEYVAARLREILPMMPVVLTPFTDDALESALRREEIDLAVHRLEDMPTLTSDEFVVAAIPQRASPYDVLISRQHHKFHELPRGAKIGVDNLVRAAQLKSLRPDLETLPLRGDILAQLTALLAADSPYDAIILALADLERLRLTEYITELLTPEVMLPIAGQGALAVQCRADNTLLRRLLSRLDNGAARLEIEAERALVSMTELGCHLPVAALARVNHRVLSLTGRVISTTGDLSLTLHSQLDLTHDDLTAYNEALFRRVRATAYQLGEALADQAVHHEADVLLPVE